MSAQRHGELYRHESRRDRDSGRLRRNVILFAEYLHELAGPAITLAGGHGADVGVVQIDVNF